MSAFILNIGTAVPAHKIQQDTVLRFMQKAHQAEGEDAKKLELLYRATGIKTRYSVLEDYQRARDYTFFPENKALEPFPSTKSRQDIYYREALALSEKSTRMAIGDMDPARITHLITVSCTGLHAPGLDIELIPILGLSNDVQRTAINFMGCYAAANALKVAEAFCREQTEVCVLIVCTELCTLHFQKEFTENNMLANALFGDGSAAAVVSNRSRPGALELAHFFATIEPAGKSEMAWGIGNTGFEMTLSAYVPEFLKTGVSRMIQRLNKHIPMNSIDYYALHPGGKKILQVLEQVLEIGRDRNQFSREILRNYGNMSSPTLLFVLHSIMEEIQEQDHGKKILALAFGPGLTLESMLLNVVEA